MNSGTKLGRVAGMLVAGAALVAAGCGRSHGDATSAGPREVAVRTAVVESAQVSRPVLATGVLAGKEEVPLAFKVGGVIARIDVEEGQAVRPGQRMAALELPEIGAMVAKAEAGLAKADRDLARAKALYADSVITRELYDNAQTARDVAHSDARAARFNAGTATILAPGAGTVLRRLAEPGQTVGPGMPILVFSGAGNGQVVRAGIADRDVVRLSVGDAAAVRFDAFPGRTWPGRVTRIGAAAAPGAGTYEVEVRLAGPVRVAEGAALASGLVAEITLTPARTQAVKWVPVAALVEGDGDHAGVWALTSDGRAVRHAVQLAFIDGDRAAVTSGLEGLERIVVEGAPFLTEDARPRESGR
jgi:RND family efflux transporter MFP subunit